MTSPVARQSTIAERPRSRYPCSCGMLHERCWDVAQLLPAVDAPHPNLPTGQQAKQEQLRRLGVGERALRLDASPELAMEPLDRIGGPQRLPLAPREAKEGKKTLPGFLQAPR